MITFNMASFTVSGGAALSNGGFIALTGPTTQITLNIITSTFTSIQSSLNSAEDSLTSVNDGGGIAWIKVYYLKMAMQGNSFS